MSNADMTAKVDSECSYLMVSLDGLTLKQLGEQFPEANVLLHVKDENGVIVPVTLEDIRRLKG